jgi:hypothetical protein
MSSASEIGVAGSGGLLLLAAAALIFLFDSSRCQSSQGYEQCREDARVQWYQGKQTKSKYTMIEIQLS